MNTNRFKFVPLKETHIQKAVIGEIVLNSESGHISTISKSGHTVSATKRIESKVDYIESTLKNKPNSTSLNAVCIKEESFFVDQYIEIDPIDGKQIFTLKEGEYEMGLNRLEVFIGVVRCTTAKGNLIEVDERSFKLEENLEYGLVVDAKYYEVLKNPESSFNIQVIIQDRKPDIDKLTPGTIWVSSDKIL